MYAADVCVLVQIPAWHGNMLALGDTRVPSIATMVLASLLTVLDGSWHQARRHRILWPDEVVVNDMVC